MEAPISDTDSLQRICDLVQESKPRGFQFGDVLFAIMQAARQFPRLSKLTVALKFQQFTLCTLKLKHCEGWTLSSVYAGDPNHRPSPRQSKLTGKKQSPKQLGPSSRCASRTVQPAATAK
jgi:hypothetical protein